MSVQSPIERAVKVLRENKYFVLGTIDDKGPWACVLAHAMSPPSSFFFFSPRSSRHAKALSNQTKISGVLYNSMCTFEEVESIQFQGFGQIDHTLDQVKYALEICAKRDKSNPPSRQDIEKAFNNEKIALYRIDINDAYVLDQELYESEGIDARTSFDAELAFKQVLC